MVYLNAHYNVPLGNLWVNKINISFLQQLDLKNKNETKVQLYLFGINGLTYLKCPALAQMGHSGLCVA